MAPVQAHSVLPHREPDTVTPRPVRPGIDLQVNGEHFRHTGDPDMPLLWYLRDVLKLDGTRYAGEHGEGGADLVLVDDRAHSSITLPMHRLAHRRVTTVEGLVLPDGSLHPLQQAFIDEDAIGCGYCTSGWLIAAMSLLRQHPTPTDDDIDTLPNLCRCGCQTRVRAAIKRAATAMKEPRP
ncbi:(2Fe-2S)-binding protein [Dyella sp. A6]|uniref:(2Fe-2S)-binding protein n=1 Tax=Dyella aluminiiresistens TaxID=3069105 RepID=UPI002E77C573|nr:(2Fe-2S)-binding protein [Dyella sp. A6]